MNDLIKGDGGVIGITGNHSALIKWINAGPEISRSVGEFDSYKRYAVLSIQAKVASHVKAMVAAFEESGKILSMKIVKIWLF